MNNRTPAGTGLLSVPAFRSVDQLSGQRRPSKFFAALQTADQQAATAQLQAEAFAKAAGYYDCPCGSEFEFFADGSLEDYAALNRWLGRHVGVCGAD